MDETRAGLAALVVDGGDGVRSARRSLRHQIWVGGVVWVALIGYVVAFDDDAFSVVYVVMFSTLMVGNAFFVQPWRARQQLAPYSSPDSLAGRMVAPDPRRFRPAWRHVRGGTGLVLGVTGVTVAPRSSWAGARAALWWSDIDRIEVERRRWRPLVVLIAGGEPVVGMLTSGRRAELVTVLDAALARVAHRRATDPVLSRSADA